MVVIKVPRPFLPLAHAHHLHDLLSKIGANANSRVLFDADELARHEFKYHSLRPVEREPWFKQGMNHSQIHELALRHGQHLVVALPSDHAHFQRSDLPQPTHISGSHIAAYQGK